ncbi:protein kinase [Aeoliella sp. ICT_H6.2]|uniref:Protein kinase n=1 Tax=Aeoliella straminimaris TaxID=2954799 RepID=A0A9X2FHE2_9BACT|nr:protein kinase [Aeoliella straminimaris]MCO6045936.1 protein kinase [Aeoliella straminimaris]
MKSRAIHDDVKTAADPPHELCEMLVAYDEHGPLDAWQESELPEELRQRFAVDRHCLDLLHRAWPAEPPPEPDPASPRELGDFRIVREIGRGGMGIVYEAEQLSLGRRVALKVLPFAAVLDANQLLRFKNEAQAAASLHREGIVPVYAVGCDRGVHYYAMQLIEGQTLAEWIADQRHAIGSSQGGKQVSLSADTAPVAELETKKTQASSNSVRRAAELAAEAAESLEYAHEQGIVHRDIKPSNLLVDSRGRAWITDFGLARVEANPALTASGDMLGTLRYMSPEQATGKATDVNHRADVYGLGAALYEMLILRPVHDAKERGRLLKQIADDEPSGLRSLNFQVPIDLETIVLKSLAKDPVDRYDTAGAMAADLRRFLAGNEISARRPGLIERAKRWLRRRPHVAMSLAAIIAVLLIASTVATAISRQSQRDTAAALTSADANFDLAMKAIDRAVKTGEDDGINRQEEMLQDAAKLYRQLVPPVSTTPRELTNKERTFHQRRSEVLYRLAALQRQRGDYKVAEQTAREAIEAGQGLVKRDPGDPAAARILAVGYNSLGDVYYKSMHYVEAEHVYSAGLPVVYAAREMPDALVETEAWLLGGLARVHWVFNRHEQAEDAFSVALKAEERLLSGADRDSTALSNHAGTLNDYAMLLHNQGKRHEAIIHLKQAVALELEAREVAPENTSIPLFLHHHLCLLAREYNSAGDDQACLDTCQLIATNLPRKLRSYSSAAEFGSYTLEHLKQAKSLPAGKLAEHQAQVRIWLAEAVVAPEFEPEFLHRHVGLLTQSPDSITYDPQTAVTLGKRLVRTRPEVARFWTMLALAHTRSGDPAAATEAIARAEGATQDADSDTDLLIVRTLICQASGDVEQAKACYQELAAWRSEHEHQMEDSEWHLRLVAELDGIFADLETSSATAGTIKQHHHEVAP